MRAIIVSGLAVAALFMMGMKNQPIEDPQAELVRLSGIKEEYKISEKIVLDIQSLSDETLHYSCYVEHYHADEEKWHELTYVCEAPQLSKPRYQVYQLKALSKKQTFWNFDRTWVGGIPREWQYRFRLDFYYGETPINPYRSIYSETFRFKQE
jgi:hypothetical protein